MKRTLVCLAVTLLLFSNTAYAAGNDASKARFVKAEIFYYGWDTLTRARLTFDDLRNRYWIRIEIVNEYEVSQLVGFLRLDEMVVTSGDIEDPRLLIDLYDASGDRTTYYASRFNLNSEDSRRKRKINDSFRRKFHF